VAAWPLQALGSGQAGVELDRVQRPSQAPAALQQAHALGQDLVRGELAARVRSSMGRVGPHETARQQLL
jgi:hypothetical protein